MDEKPGDARRREAQPRVLSRLPKETADSRTQMARVLRRYRWLLDAIAHQHLGETPEAQEAVSAVIAKMVAIDEPRMGHALRTITQQLHFECYRLERQRTRRAAEIERRRGDDAPYDPVLGRLSDDTLAAIDRLPQAQRSVLSLAIKGLGVTDIAAALNLRPRTVSMRLYRARKRLARGGGVGRRVLLLPLASAGRRLEHLRSRAFGAVRRVSDGALLGVQTTSGWSEQFSAAATLFIVMVYAVGSGPPLGTPVRHGPAPTSAIAAPAEAAAPPSVADANPLGGDTHRKVMALRGPIVPFLPSLPTPPGDVRLVALTPASEFDRNHTAVGLGESASCHCFAVFESTDGGASWRSAPGPVAGAQVVLPPTYPQDPRIFIGNPAEATHRADYVAARFGAPFAPLPVPSGPLALSGRFDDGEPVGYVSTATGVLSLDMSSATPSVAVISSGQWGDASLAPDPDGSGILALVPPGSLSAPAMSEPWAAASTGDSLLGCSRQLCTHVADTGSTLAETLTLSTTYARDHLLAAWGAASATLSLSTDGGRSFQSRSLPPAMSIHSVTLEGGRLWVAAADGTGALVVLWIDAARADWHEVALPASAASAPATLVALGYGRVVLLAGTRGFWCTGDVGLTWERTCPVA